MIQSIQTHVVLLKKQLFLLSSSRRSITHSKSSFIHHSNTNSMVNYPAGISSSNPANSLGISSLSSTPGGPGVVTLQPSHAEDEYVEITDPQTGSIFYANIRTGDCTWDRPAIVKPKDPNLLEWWELFDENHKLPYFYNTKTGETEWVRPSEGLIIPLVAIQNSKIGKRVSMSIKRASTIHTFDNPANNPQTTEESNYSYQQPSNQRQISARTPLNKSDSSLNLEPVKNTVSDSLDVQSPLENSVAMFDKLPHTAEETTQGMGKLGLNSASNPLLSASGKSYAISDPVNNPEAAIQMNPFARSHDQLASPSKADNRVSAFRTLPSDLKSHIERFKIDGFANKYFSEHRKGLLRKRVPIEKMLHFQKESLKSPLMVLNKSVQKDALKCFKLIQRIMGDRPPSTKGTVVDDIQAVTDYGILQNDLRDEIYVQLCKQLTNNPMMSPYGNSLVKGWQLFCVFVIAFPPSKNLEDYLKSYVRQQFNPAKPHPLPVANPASLSTEDAVNQISRHVYKKLDKICKTGPRGKSIPVAEIERAMEAPFKISIFGESLEEVMKIQNDADEALGAKRQEIPKILPFLATAILELNGCKTEGIFRVPGDADAVTELRCRIEKGDYSMQGITDPNVPSSLLKLWLRELAQPLIPADFYPLCTNIGADEGQPEATDKALQLVESLPDLNRKVVKFMIKFLKTVGEPANIPSTKMTHQNIAMVFAPNFLRCPSDNPTVIFENTKFEQAFLRLLFANSAI